MKVLDWVVWVGKRREIQVFDCFDSLPENPKNTKTRLSQSAKRTQAKKRWIEPFLLYETGSNCCELISCWKNLRFRSVKRTFEILRYLLRTSHISFSKGSGNCFVKLSYEGSQIIFKLIPRKPLQNVLRRFSELLSRNILEFPVKTSKNILTRPPVKANFESRCSQSTCLASQLLAEFTGKKLE